MGSFLEDIIKCSYNDKSTDYEDEFYKRLSIAHSLGEDLANFLQSDEKYEYMANKSLITKRMTPFGRSTSITFIAVEADKIPKFFLDMYKENFTGFHQRSTIGNRMLQLMIMEFNKSIMQTLDLEKLGIPLDLKCVLVEFDKDLSNPDIFKSISIELYDFIPYYVQ
jgi:hypothetical protein